MTLLTTEERTSSPTPGVDFVEFGKYLSKQRELRGVTRESVSQTTKISPTLVAALEEGQAERLPSRVFVLNYVKSYAQAIGLSPEDAINRFHEIPGTRAPSEMSPVELESRRKRRAIYYLLAVVVLVLALGAGFFQLSQLEPRQSKTVDAKNQ